MLDKKKESLDPDFDKWFDNLKGFLFIMSLIFFCPAQNFSHVVVKDAHPGY